MRCVLLKRVAGGWTAFAYTRFPADPVANATARTMQGALALIEEVFPGPVPDAPLAPGGWHESWPKPKPLDPERSDYSPI